MVQQDGSIAYFLGANSGDGFFSLYDELIEESRAAAFYVLKGGPGCGKSTLMRKVGQKLEEAGFAVEYIICSGDPDSLDGILIPEKAIAMVDGTSPHVIEPSYPGALGHYINLGKYYDRKALRSSGEELVRLTKAYKSCYTRAYQCLRAAREIRRKGEQVFLTNTAISKAEKRADGILSRELRKKVGGHGKEVRRFLSGITCEGILSLHETVYSQCKRVYELQESCGLASVMLNRIREGALVAGYDLVVCPLGEDPEKLAHILIPELSLAFVTTVGGETLGKRPYRRIRMDTIADRELLKEHRSKLRFSNRMADELVKDGIRELRGAKAFHDQMEALYHPHVDFKGVDKLTAELTREILSFS
ncbi:MAG: ATPase [Firmicutes bacterium]|nr:ATPase [Bacillota bacterium]